MWTVIEILARLIALVFVFSPHEFAHAYIAYKNGDPTANMRGRMTLNPLKHLDPVGYFLCAVAGFGWARPVPINPYNFKKYKLGLFTTAIAGVVANYIVAFFAFLIYVLLGRFVSQIASINTLLFFVYYFIETVFYMIFLYSLFSVVFNLLPLYPLDGFRIVESFTRQINPVRRFLRNYGQIILIIIVAENIFCSYLAPYLPILRYFNVLSYVSWFAQNIVGFPIKAAWSWITRI